MTLLRVLVVIALLVGLGLLTVDQRLKLNRSGYDLALLEAHRDALKRSLADRQGRYEQITTPNNAGKILERQRRSEETTGAADENTQ